MSKKKKLLRKILSVSLCAALLGSTAVTLPAVTQNSSIVVNAAEEESNYEYEVNDDSTVTIKKYLGNETSFILPSMLGGKTVTSIASCAFENCSGITHVYLPETITSIGMAAFRSCTGLTDITISNNVTSVGKEAFSGCTALTTALIGRNVEKLDDNTFEGCTALASVALSNSSVAFGNDVFKDCTGLTIYAISGSTTERYATANSINFVATNYLYEENAEGGITITRYIGDDTEVVIPSMIDGKAVKKLADESFWDCSSMTSVTIPDGVTSIGMASFWNCKNLTSVNISDSVTEIGLGAFYGCSGLKNITIPENVTKINALTFYQCKSLEKVNVLGRITEIGASAFNYCSMLKRFIIPGSVETIGASAFSGTPITSIEIPLSVTSIGNNAFSECKYLNTITIPGSQVKFGTNVFLHTTGVTIYGRDDSTAQTYANENNIPFQTIVFDYAENSDGGLTLIKYSGTGQSVSIPSDVGGKPVTSIGTWVFNGHSEITYVYIPDSITTIGWAAFSSCTGLTSVTIPNSVTTIGSEAFSGCTALEDVTIGRSVNKINYSAFEGCTALNSAVVLNRYTNFGDNVFKDCPDLTVYATSDSTTESYAAANSINFVATDYLYEENVAGEITITKYLGDDAELVIPSMIDGKPVTKLADEAFWDCLSMTSLTIPDSVTSIGMGSFYNCKNLTSLNIPDSVTEIGLGAFYGCSGLKSISISKNVTRIGVLSFYQCTALETVELRGDVTEIGASAFNYCSSLKNINIPETVTKIGASAFNGTAITSIEIPSSVTNIDNNAFAYCTDLEKIIILNSEVEFGTNVFLKTPGVTIYGKAGSTAETYASDNNIPFVAVSYLYKLNDDGRSVTITKYIEGAENVVVPDTIDGYAVTGIGALAFKDCTALKSVSIPNGVTSIGNAAFQGCTNLESVTIPDGVTVIGVMLFYECANLSGIVIPAGVTRIDPAAFYGCSSLARVNIPNGVTFIGDSAFSECTSLTSITIPDSVTVIRYAAFCGCTGLTRIDIPDSVTTIGSIVFDGCDDLTIYGVNGSTAEKYANDEDIPFVAVSKELENNSTVAKTSVPQNTSVFVKGAAKGGSGEYKYAFYYKKSTSGAWQTIGELYGNTKEVSFVPATVAKYLVKVNVKDSTGKIVTKIFEVNSTKPQGNDLVNKSVLDKMTTQRGTPITITGDASGGAGGYKYAFYYKKTTSKAFTAIGTEYGDAATATFTPASAAEYNVRINVKDADGTIVTKQYKITSTAAAELKNTSTVSATDVAKGTAITLTGAATGGKSPYTYTFYYKKSTSSSWTKISADSNTAVFTPAMKAAYNVKISVKDSSGKTADKTFTITSK